VNVRLMIASGAALGVVYSLSPLSVLCLAGLGFLIHSTGRQLSGRERDWFYILFATAVAARLVIIGVLVLSADGSKPYTVFFGDEWIFKSRPIWLRNVGLGIPISAADFIYAFDETGMSGHLYALAFLQALVGDAPYGVHLFSVTVYVGAVALLYTMVRSTFGALTAFGGCVVLLFLPSLFAWSISALKEPIYIAVAVFELVAVVAVVRASRWRGRIGAAIALVVLAFAMEELRKGTLLVAGLGVSVGLSGWWLLQAPRRIYAAAVVIPIVLGIAVSQAPVQARLLDLAHQSIKYHAGHVVTPGVSYQLVDPPIYSNWGLIPQVGRREAIRFVVRAAIAYVVEPLPRHMQSRLLWAFLPEHLVWLMLVALVPVGVIAGVKRDPGLSAVLIAHAAAIMMMVALASGNIGTLIRHRGLALPYLVWFSVLGAIALAARLQPPARAEQSSGDEL
jgi:hypothetical protein